MAAGHKCVEHHTPPLEMRRASPMSDSQVEKKGARRPGSREMEEEAARVLGVVEPADEDEEGKFEELAPPS